MRAQTFRKFVVTTAGLALVSFCSCERHAADELHHGDGHGATEAEHRHSDAAVKEAPHDKEHGTHGGDQQQMSTTALTPTPSPGHH
jgi:hypothetical protein